MLLFQGSTSILFLLNRTDGIVITLACEKSLPAFPSQCQEVMLFIIPEYIHIVLKMFINARNFTNFHTQDLFIKS